MTTEDVLRRSQAGLNVLVPPLAAAIGMSRGGLYQAIARGEVTCVKVGRAIYVPAYEARRLLGLSQQGEAPSPPEPIAA